MHAAGLRCVTKLQPPLLIVRQRHYWRNMDCTALMPPDCVRGMTQLQRDAFRKTIKVPMLRVPEAQAQTVLPLLKKLLLKMEQLRPVRTLGPTPADATIYKEILLHPLPVQSWDSLPHVELEQLQITPLQFHIDDLELGYANWRADEILRQVLPAGEEGVTSYSRIGHIVHLNLRDHLLPYRQLIGEVLRDKVPGCRTVVNKASTIDSTYRNFQLDLICGESEYQVETKENGVWFQFDFSKVYWNPRLSTEHERITQLLQSGDVLYDVFAGVGPFAVPAARKNCQVLANDLNPESYRWLQHNAKRNKCLGRLRTFNKDGGAFIREELKQDLLQRWENAKSNGRIHITMNLPALAVEFLSAYRGLFADLPAEKFPASADMPLVHVYSFAKGEDTKSLVLSIVEEHLGMKLDDNLEGIYFVRNVAPNKDMYRVSFRLTKEILSTPVQGFDDKESNSRKRAADDSFDNEQNEEQSFKVKCSS